MSKSTKTAPPETRGRKPRHDWAEMGVGDSVPGNSGSAAYWARKLGREFVVRAGRVWRTA